MECLECSSHVDLLSILSEHHAVLDRDLLQHHGVLGDADHHLLAQGGSDIVPGQQLRDGGVEGPVTIQLLSKISKLLQLPLKHIYYNTGDW